MRPWARVHPTGQEAAEGCRQVFALIGVPADRPGPPQKMRSGTFEDISQRPEKLFLGRLQAKGPQRRPQRRLDRRLEEIAKAVGGGYRRLRMPLKQAPGVGVTVAGHRLGVREGGCTSPH